MSRRTTIFRMCDFSEQFIPAPSSFGCAVYSAVMHVDGRVYEHRRALRSDHGVPIENLRANAWLCLLESIMKGKTL